MNTALSVLAGLNINVKQLSLRNIIVLQNNINVKDETFIGLTGFISGLTESSLDKMTTT